MSIDIATLRPRLEAALGERLQLGALLGQGGFAAVFRAHDPFLEESDITSSPSRAAARRAASSS
jgi:hypothetical protein